MKRRTQRMTEYAAASCVLVVMMAWLSATALGEHRDHRRASAKIAHEKDLRVALWRLETRVGSVLERIEVPAQTSASIDPGVFLCKSLDPVSGDVEDLAREGEEGWVASAVRAADKAFEAGCSIESMETCGTTAGDLQMRTEVSRTTKRWVDDALEDQCADTESSVTIGPLATVWDVRQTPDGSCFQELVLTRRVQRGGDAMHESFRVSWASLRDQLMPEIDGLVPDPQLVPITGEERGAAFGGARLASIPVRLLTVPLDELPMSEISRGFLLSLMGAWGALAVALGCGGVALRAALAYGDKHRRFTHAVTHELRTPLTTFRMYSEMLRAGMVPDEARAEYFATLESESTRLARLVENVLRYARIEDASGGAELVDVDLHAALVTMQGELERLASGCPESLGDLRVDVSAIRGVHVRTDVTVLQQVLLNLVENACKYGRGPDGTLRIDVIASADAGRVVIDVRDQGAGIPAKEQRAVFEPFERAGRDASDPAPGVGLGLALARGLARDIGGELTLRSASKRSAGTAGGAAVGATFRLTLPLRDGSGALGAERDMPDYSGERVPLT